MHYKGSPKSIGEIGRELGLDYILEGGVRRYGRRVRLTARLIAAHDQGHIWADSFEVQLPPIFSLQQALARQLADSLAAELHITPRKGRRATTSNLAAYHTYTEGRSHFLDTDGDVKKSIEKLSLAIEQDPNFAPGYAQLALEYFRRFFLDYPPIVMMRRVDALASQALKLDPKLVRAQAMLAAYHLFGSRNWRKAEAASRRAIKLNPSFALAWIIRAAYHVVVGELKEAVEELGQAHQINPQSAESNLWIAFVAYFARRYDLAIERGQEILHLDPSRPEIRGVLGLCYAQKGEYSLALSQCEVLKELGKGAFSYSAAACSIYALAGERDSAERLLQELVAAKEQAYMRYIFLAQASASLGQGRQTLEWLEKAYEQRDPLLVFLKADARFDPVSGLPAFRKLLRRLGLAMS
jgi:tetratricopeptide (TPR) repeat protein